MNSTQDRPRRRLLIAGIAGGAVLLVLVSLGIYGLARGPETDPFTNPNLTDPSPRSEPTPSATTPDGPQTVPTTSDPGVFARAVAAALFNWTATGEYDPADYAQSLVDVADDDEAAALAADVRAYLPPAAAWAQLRTYQARQWLTIDDAVVPEAWEAATAQALPGQIPPGATAYTITGTRHRTGIWGTEPVDVSRPVSFTVFIACTPPAPEFGAGPCRLLRLSQLDNPLH